MNAAAMARALAAQQTATESGYTMALKWCLRCDVGWAGVGVKTCWLCEQGDEVYFWTFKSGHPEMERIAP